MYYTYRFFYDPDRKRLALWQLTRMPTHWYVALAVALGTTLMFYNLAPPDPDIARHEASVRSALACSLAAAALLSVLTGLVHHGRRRRAGVMLMGVATAANAGIFTGYAALFGLFGF
ncbi:hypothetical protein [Vannielia litorea]|uniref:hypothetical protein n=1 Tax=Vannielia litorea TaxID=1217970 RepID=UPI001C982E0D|nr:hypothetical protein [Vannielia litorea]MBY6049612.1 hypothetical protein [Vannielia litorea]MBY6077026.1 hypothetical protein [Vannielia litorea]